MAGKRVSSHFLLVQVTPANPSREFGPGALDPIELSLAVLRAGRRNSLGSGSRGSYSAKYSF